MNKRLDYIKHLPGVSSQTLERARALQARLEATLNVFKHTDSEAAMFESSLACSWTPEQIAEAKRKAAGNE